MFNTSSFEARLTPTQHHLVLGGFYVLALLLTYVTLVLPGTTYVATWLNDTFALLNGAYRVSVGQVPYLDFHALYGPTVFYIPAVGLKLGIEPSAIFAFNGFVVSAFLLLAGMLIMARRFSLAVTIIVLFVLWLLISVPIPSGLSFRNVTWGTFYNRHGWAAVSLVFLLYIDPRVTTFPGKILDSAVLAFLTAFLLYTKITFGLVALGFIIANAIPSKYNRHVSLISLGFIGAILGIVEIGTGLTSAYLSNIFATAGRSSFPLHGAWGLLQMLLSQAWVFGICIAALLIMRANGRRSFLDVAYALGAMLASIALLDTTGGAPKGMPALMALLACTVELTRRIEFSAIAGINSATADQSSRQWGSRTLFILLLIFFLEPISNRLIGWHDHYTKTVSEPLPAILDSASGLSGFLVKEDPWQLHHQLGHSDSAHATLQTMRELTGESANTLSPYAYMQTIDEGLSLLNTVDLRGKKLFVLDNADPFTVGLGLLPTQNGYPILWVSSFSAHNHPPADILFADVNYVMVPILPYQPFTPKVMIEIYGDYIAERFTESKRSPHWRLLARNSDTP